ncbi:MAG: type I polyketide synthase, partial [Deltaproteobacteria bacterium]|nr:type I polyketide synthase [Deltaproteobacteria bacterium]
MSTMTIDGNCAHVILEGYEYPTGTKLYDRVSFEREKPLGLKNSGLFIVEAESPEGLIEELDALLLHLRQSADKYSGIGLSAHTWLKKRRPAPWKKYALSLVSSNVAKLDKWIAEAKAAVRSGTPKKIVGPDGIKYSPEPVGRSGKIAFVFPGSGNHYVGMGREVGVNWPDILREMDLQTSRLKTQLIPNCYIPWRNSWEYGWKDQADKKIASHPHHMIFGQVTHGCMMAGLVQSFNVKPAAVIGYSLGESAGLFAMGAWPERGRMLERLEQSELFKTELAGPCTAAKKVWNLSADEAVEWRVAGVNRSADIVEKVIKKVPRAYLLIVNTPEECVIGGQKSQVETAINMLGCDAVFLQGVVTVHCEVAVPVRDAYKELHRFPANSLEDIRFYSCARSRAYDITPENAATSMLKQALDGFDFPATINQAYKDG